MHKSQRKRAVGRKESAGALNLGLDVGERRGDEAAGGGAATVAAWRRWSGDVRAGAVFDDERSWSDKGGDLGIAKLIEQTENVAVDRFLPKLFAGSKVATDQGGINSGVQRGCVERQ